MKDAKIAEVETLLKQALDDHRHGWSIGTFGAIGEFVRGENEPAWRADDDKTIGIVTARGGIRISVRTATHVLAFDTLSGDGETWNQAVAFYMRKMENPAPRTVRKMGPDINALRPEDRDAVLFDTGVASGLVKMCIRTRDENMIAALTEIEGQSLLDPAGRTAAGLIVATGPNRVMLSPMGRIEVYVPIPASDGESPLGPHTHLLPKLIASGRTHAANAPIPDGMQPVLYLHPRSPWRDAAGKRTSFDGALDAYFNSLWQRYASPSDIEVRKATEAAIEKYTDPRLYSWPTTRRSRAQARITLRRLTHALGSERTSAWRALYDRAPAEDDEPSTEAAH